MLLIRDWYGRLGQARQTAPPSALIDVPPPAASDEEIRWARRETEAIIRRARALDIDVALDRAGRRRSRYS